MTARPPGETVPEQLIQMDPKEIHAVVDTNVLLDIFSCHDISNAYAQFGELTAEQEIDLPPAVYRRARARESLLLAFYFHAQKATTYSLKDEVLAIMQGRVDPSADDTWHTQHTMQFAHFVTNQLLSGWRLASQPSLGAAALQGDDADAHLVEYAREHGLPLITNEGFGPTGIRAEKMRKLATDAGVNVFAPGEFWRGQIDESSEIEDFLRRFRKQAPAYAAARAKPRLEREALDRMNGYFRHVLLGETAGRDAPVRVIV